MKVTRQPLSSRHDKAITTTRQAFIQHSLSIKRDLKPPPAHCRSELARDGGVSGNKDIECQTIASKLAPTRFTLKPAPDAYSASGCRAFQLRPPARRY
ncbi:hypothetical protein EJA72_24375 [Pseudomonas sp. PB120]|nr:hypothetical protein [Pseudomonas sp. PB120]